MFNYDVFDKSLHQAIFIYPDNGYLTVSRNRLRLQYNRIACLQNQLAIDLLVVRLYAEILEDPLLFYAND